MTQSQQAGRRLTPRSVLPFDRSAWSLRHKVVWYAWLAMLVLLPITSQPHLADLIGGRPVNPPSLIPAAVILLVGMIPYWLRGGGIPKPALPLLLFAAFAVLASALSPWLGLHPFQDADVVGRTVRGVATLGIGLSFYLAAMYVPLQEDLRRVSLRVIVYGAVPALLWATIQPLQFPAVPLRDTMDAIHEFLFSPRPLFRDRVTGMAVEPSWFADQLVLFYLPLWTASVLRRTSAFGAGGRWPWVETILLGWGTAMLLLSSSRSGYAAWGAVLLCLALVLGWKAGRGLVPWLQKKSPHFRRASPLGLQRAAGPAGVAVSLGLLAVAALSVILISSRLDRRMDRLFHLELAGEPGIQQPTWLMVAKQLEYAERVTYWVAAGRVFALHPVLGVGLGNSGFFFAKVIPATSYDLLDVLGAVGQLPGPFPNPKSLWFRLLAETGLVGFVVFLTWLTVAFACAWAITRRSRGLAGVIGLATVLCLIALVVEGLSLDTFALPYLWLLPGMTAGLWKPASPEAVPA